MMALYAPEAVFIANDGRIIRDRTEIAGQFQRDMSLGLPLKANVRHVFVVDDTSERARGIVTSTYSGPSYARHAVGFAPRACPIKAIS
jgi:hypothetical protein